MYLKRQEQSENFYADVHKMYVESFNELYKEIQIVYTTYVYDTGRVGVPVFAQLTQIENVIISKLRKLNLYIFKNKCGSIKRSAIDRQLLNTDTSLLLLCPASSLPFSWQRNFLGNKNTIHNFL